MLGLSLIVAGGGLLSSLGVLASHGAGFLWSTSSRVYGFSSCGTQDQLPHRVWSLLGSGMEPTCPALVGRFSAKGGSSLGLLK